MDSSVCIAETSTVFIQVFNSCLIVKLVFSVVLKALNFETEIALVNLCVTIIKDMRNNVCCGEW